MVEPITFVINTIKKVLDTIKESINSVRAMFDKIRVFFKTMAEELMGNQQLNNSTDNGDDK